eukprot:g1232.t1
MSAFSSTATADKMPPPSPRGALSRAAHAPSSFAAPHGFVPAGASSAESDGSGSSRMSDQSVSEAFAEIGMKVPESATGSASSTAPMSKPIPRKRALTDSADEREALARGNIDFALSPGVHTLSEVNCVSGGHSSGSSIQNGGSATASTATVANGNIGKDETLMMPADSILGKPTTPSRRRSTSAMTADNLDEAQSEKLTKVMRAIMVMRIKQADSTPIEIIPGLFIGSIGAALNKEGLIAAGITHVLCAAGGIKLYFPETFTYKQVVIGDKINSDMYSHLPGCCNFIGKALKPGGKVLVHCFAGQSRSATVIAAYLMLTKKLSLQAAVELMRSKRKQVQPNPGFCAQLLKWGKYIASLSPKGSPEEQRQQMPRAAGLSAGVVGNHGPGRPRRRRASSPLAHEIPISDVAAAIL